MTQVSQTFTIRKPPADGKPVGANLIDGSDLRKREPWITFKGTVTDGAGMFSTDALHHAVAGTSPTEYEDILQQELRMTSKGIEKLKPGRWYTLSFWAKGNDLQTFIYGNGALPDTSVQSIVNGKPQATPSDGRVVWRLTSEWSLCAFTFKIAANPSDGHILFRCVKGGDVTVSAIKLEEGQHATTWCLAEADKKGEQGPQGLDGCIQRVTEWVICAEYRNDRELTTWPRYVDVVVVTHQSGQTFEVYQCLKTHVSDNIRYDNAEYWQPMNNMAPIYTPLIIAEYAFLRFTQTNQLLVTNDNAQVILGLGGGDYPIWIGGQTPYSPNTKFKVSQDGYMDAQGGSFSGLVRHRSTLITPLNYKEFLTPTGDGNYMLDMETCGTYLIYEDAPTVKWRDADKDMQQALSVILPGYKKGDAESDTYANHFELIGNRLIVENRTEPPATTGFVPDVKLKTFMDSAPSHTIPPETVGVGECKFSLVGQTKKDYSIFWDFKNTRPAYYKPVSIASDVE